MNSVCVHIVDDDDAVRDALSLLMTASGFATRSYSSAEGFFGVGAGNHAGIAIVDMRMSGMTGLEMLVELRSRGSNMPVIILTGHGDVPLAVEAIKSGAHDFLEKPFNDDVLVAIVRRAMAKWHELDQAQSEADAVRVRLSTLSGRERDVLPLLISGKPNKIIAAQLEISMRTVEVHRARIFAKMGVRSAVELAAMLSARR